MAGDLSAHPISDLVEPHIRFERVRTGDIKIHVVLRAHDQAGRLVHLAGDRLETHRYRDILGRDVIADADRKPVISGVTAGLGDDPAAWRRSVAKHQPADRITLTGQPLSETRRLSADRHRRNIDLQGFPHRSTTSATPEASNSSKTVLRTPTSLSWPNSCRNVFGKEVAAACLRQVYASVGRPRKSGRIRYLSKDAVTRDEALAARAAGERYSPSEGMSGFSLRRPVASARSL